MSKINYKILVIYDNKKSSVNQAMGLANLIKINIKKEVKIKKIKFYREWMKFFPNSLIFHLLKLKILKFDIKFSLNDIDLMISCGRVTAPLSLYFKNKKMIKNFHIFDPYLKPNYFDKIFIPHHDIKIKYKNVIRVDGSIVNEEAKNITKKEIYYFKKKISFPKNGNNICILIGGNGRSSFFNESDIKTFINYLDKIDKERFKLFFLFSRRTPNDLKNLIKFHFNNISYIWDEKSKNPYWFLLTNCDFFVITSDSITMTSEAISTNKPVFIFELNSVKEKIKEYHKKIFSSKRTKTFKGDIFKWNFVRKSENEELIKLILKEID